MSGLPAVVSILGLGSGTLSSSAVIPASMTVGGVATTLGFPVSAIMTTAFGGLPTGGGTSQILTKANASNYSTQWSNITDLVAIGTGLATSGSVTSVVVAFASQSGLSLLGVAGTASAAPLAITGTAAQVLRVNDGGTGVAFGAVNLGSSAAVTGVLPGANFSAVNLAASGAGGVQGILPFANGGSNSSATLATGGVLFSDGTRITQTSSVLYWGNASTVFAVGTTAPAILAGERQFVYGSSPSAHISLRVNNTDTTGFSTLWMGGSNEGFIRYGSNAGNKFQVVSSNTAVVVALSCGSVVDQLSARATAVIVAPPLLVLNGSAIPAGGVTGLGIMISSATNFGIFIGTGTPTLAAATGSIYLRSDGATATSRMYVNTNGSTTWTAFNTVV